MAADEATSSWLKNIAVDAIAMDVVKVNVVSIFFWPVVRQVNHGATMSVATSGR